MNLQKFKSHWEQKISLHSKGYNFFPTEEELLMVRELIDVAETAKKYLEKYNSDCPLIELRNAEDEFEKAVEGLEKR